MGMTLRDPGMIRSLWSTGGRLGWPRSEGVDGPVGCQIVYID